MTHHHSKTFRQIVEKVSIDKELGIFKGERISISDPKFLDGFIDWFLKRDTETVTGELPFQGVRGVVYVGKRNGVAISAPISIYAIDANKGFHDNIMTDIGIDPSLSSETLAPFILTTGKAGVEGWEWYDPRQIGTSGLWTGTAVSGHYPKGYAYSVLDQFLERLAVRYAS